MDDFLSHLPPEALAQLLGMGSLDERGGIIEDQLKQALALRQPTEQQHSTGIGPALGGHGDIFRGVGGGIAERDLRGQQQANLAKKDAGRATFADLLRQMGAPAAAPPGYADQQPQGELAQPMGPDSPFGPKQRAMYGAPIGPQL